MVTERGRYTDIVRPSDGNFGGMVIERPVGGVARPVAEPARPYVPGIEEGAFYAMDHEVWEGPVEIKRGFPAFRSVFPLMAAPYRGPN
jgi:hypothetical protein